MAQIQLIKKLGVFTFRELAYIHFSIIHDLFRSKETVRKDIVFDRYDVRDSIKSMERFRRVTMKWDWKFKFIILPRRDKHICNPKNKTAFVTFVSNYLVN